MKHFHQTCGASNTVYRDVLTWNGGVPLYTEVSSLGMEEFQEVSSLQGVGIEGFHCIQYTEVSSLQGVGIEGLHCIQRCPHFRVLE